MEAFQEIAAVPLAKFGVSTIYPGLFTVVKGYYDGGGSHSPKTVVLAGYFADEADCRNWKRRGPQCLTEGRRCTPPPRFTRKTITRAGTSAIRVPDWPNAFLF
jgi:hypothetical protein